MRVIALDPGLMSGIAVTGFATPRPELPENLPSPYALERPPFLTLRWLEHELNTGSVDLVACENYTPRPGAATWQPDALHIIGAAKYLCERESVEFVLQSPADAKRFSTDDKLRKLDWYCGTSGGHANDAVRHLLLVAVRRGLVDAGWLL